MRKDVEKIKRKVWSVYILTSPDGKVYVGTTTKKPKHRWENGHGYRHNKELSSDILKYGWDNFDKKVIGEFDSENTAYEIEKFLIKWMDSTNRDKGYNKSTGGKYTFSGVKMSDEQKNKIRKSLSGHKVTPEQKEKMRVALKRRWSSKEGREKLLKKMKGRKLSNDTRRKMSLSRKKKVICIETLKIYDSIKEASDSLGVCASSIGQTCNGKQNTCNKMHFEYLDEYMKKNKENYDRIARGY